MDNICYGNESYDFKLFQYFLRYSKRYVFMTIDQFVQRQKCIYYQKREILLYIQNRFLHYISDEIIFA